MRLLAFLELTMVLVGVIAVIAGQYFALPKGIYFGVFLIGAGITVGGLESVATRRIGFRTADEHYETYAGTPATIVGLMALLLGSALIATAHLLNDGLWTATVHYLTRHPGPVLIAAGLLTMGVGTLLMLNPSGRRGFAWTLFVRVPRSLLGFVLVLAAVTSVAIGVWEWFDPAAFERFVRQLQPFDWRTVVGWWKRVLYHR